MGSIIAIDGGGSQTRFVLYQEDGTQKAYIVLPSCHVLQVSEAQMVDTLHQGVRTILEQSGLSASEVRISAGLAGYGNRDLKQKITDCAAKAWPYLSFKLFSDAEIALMGALNGTDGILLIAGTGAIGVAKQGDRISRCGGWGLWLDDVGSGYWIGHQILRLFCRQADRRQPKTALYDAVRAMFHLKDDLDIVTVAMNQLMNDRTRVAAIAPLAAELWQQGDEAVCVVYHQAIAAFVEMAQTLSAAYKPTEHHPVLLSTSGGIWHTPGFLSQFIQSLPKNTRYQPQQYLAEYGAFLLNQD